LVPNRCLDNSLRVHRPALRGLNTMIFRKGTLKQELHNCLRMPSSGYRYAGQAYTRFF
jgi:hypothetical protein